MARRIYLHVGTMKSGTTYLQQLFNQNRELLADHGILWQQMARNHQAVSDFGSLRRLSPDAVGTWREFRGEVRAYPGDVLISSEMMAPWSPSRVRRLRDELAPEELRVILTARDLTRVVPSHWQETTQNLGTDTWKEWIGKVRRGPDVAPPVVGFWKHQNLPQLVSNWSTIASPGHLYVVTLPQDTSDPEELNRRFARAVDGFPDQVEPPPSGNPGLGAVSAELLRRVNVQLGELPFDQYRRGFKQTLAKEILVKRASVEPKPRLDRDEYEAIRAIALTMVEKLRTAEITVEGSLQDLVPREWPGHEPLDPGALPDSELLDAAIIGLADLGLRFGQQSRRVKQLSGKTRVPARRDVAMRHVTQRARGLVARTRSVAQRAEQFARRDGHRATPDADNRRDMQASDMPRGQSGEDAEAPTVYLHIGLPKSGTTYIQSRFHVNHRAAAAQGLLWPGPSWGVHVSAARELRNLKPGDRPDPDGAWATLARSARQWEGSGVLISMEWLSGCTGSQIAAAIQSLAPSRVEVVCTARDLLRSFVAQGQEMTKNYRSWTWDQLVTEVRDDIDGPAAQTFWRQQDLPMILGRWAEYVSPERIHLVTVPPQGSDVQLLWDRFCSVVGVDGSGFEDAKDSNPSLGAASTSLMQRLNAVAADQSISHPQYKQVIHRSIAREILAPRRAQESPIAVGAEMDGWLRERAVRLVSETQALGVDLVGEWTDLEPGVPMDGRSPDQIADSELLELCLETAVTLGVKQQAEIDRLRAANQELRAGVERRIGRATKRRLVHAASRSRSKFRPS
jgi:hypothetical protein